MSVAKQLYQLQEIDLQLEADEQTLTRLTSQLGESQAVVSARNRLNLENQRLEELKRQQRSHEWEIDDLTSKITAAEQKLYGGRVGNPKELASLQHELETLKSKRTQVEDKVLEIMEQIEQAESGVASLGKELKVLESDWQSQQQRLSSEIDELKLALNDLKHKRGTQSVSIDPQAIELYDRIKKQKGTAVAKVEQGICQGCRISLSATQLQQVRTGGLMQCSNCGRILFLA
jgi:hypothetical protein